MAALDAGPYPNQHPAHVPRKRPSGRTPHHTPTPHPRLAAIQVSARGRARRHTTATTRTSLCVADGCECGQMADEEVSAAPPRASPRCPSRHARARARLGAAARGAARAAAQRLVGRALVPRPRAAQRLSLRLCRAAQKPDVKEGGDAINLKVVTQDGSEIFFKAPRTSRARPARRRACRVLVSDPASLIRSAKRRRRSRS